jgi:fluoroquinolone resistance protein
MADPRVGRSDSHPATTVRDEDWYGEDLSGRVFDAVALTRCDLTETTSASGLIFTDCTFSTVKFNVSSHQGASFANCTFVDCTFFGATFIECKFVGAKFDRCTFDQLTITDGDWSFAGLRGADLHNATIRGVRMRETDLTGAQCAGATMRDLDLSGAQLDKANFDGCDLRGSDVSSLDPWSASIRRAIVDPVQALTIATALGLEVRES